VRAHVGEAAAAAAAAAKRLPAEAPFISVA
jgi:hypothetical protein